MNDHATFGYLCDIYVLKVYQFDEYTDYIQAEPLETSSVTLLRIIPQREPPDNPRSLPGNLRVVTEPCRRNTESNF